MGMFRVKWGLIISCVILTLVLFSVVKLAFLMDENVTVQEISLESFHQLADKQQFLSHVEDMYRLQKSINFELSRLEQTRNQLKLDISNLKLKYSATENNLAQMETTIKQIRVDIENLLEKKAQALTNYPSISYPKKLLPNEDDIWLQKPDGICDMASCFDFSRCSVIGGFPVYLYDVYSDDSLVTAWKSGLHNSVYLTTKSEEACAFIAIIDSDEKQNTLEKLAYWHGDGRNHIVINLAPKPMDLSNTRALLAQSYHDRKSYRQNFDILLPHQEPVGLDWPMLPLLLPIQRALLLTYYGTIPTSEMSATEQDFIYAFKALTSSAHSVVISTDCNPQHPCQKGSEWCSCEPHKNWKEPASIFKLIPNTKYISYQSFTFRLYNSLVAGSVPVILGNFHPLPFNVLINWSKAAVILAKQRVTETVFIVRNILEPDIVSYKKKGRYIFQTYLNSVSQVSETLLGLLRERLGIPPAPVPRTQASVIYSDTNPMQTFDATPPKAEEILGPVEEPFPSIVYQRNFTGWQKLNGVEFLYPNTPWDPTLPSDAPFQGSPYGFRPIEKGAGGSGKEFSRSLGGNHPAEQFTIVVLTYNRADLLQLMLSQLNGLPYLNKILVVWNNPNSPDSSMKWPKIHVPIVVVKASKNSLNNRFIPYDEIETEAVLSMDDDMYLRDFEIILAFRVWRENRDRIVGFPGRYHAWNAHDNVWNYNSNHSCELSMILTGAGFFHKYYMYQYTYAMPQAIRDKVDDFMNCEDIAMNFLVSHITDKPPIKTTSRWTFRCPTCGDSSLWVDESHFKERHECINFFIQVYGYLPLRFTQFRADSVLFKTRVPQDKTKCFATV